MYRNDMDYSYEQNLIDQGYQYICGIDEAGRGPWAGPLVAGAVILDSNKDDYFPLLNDSKQLTAKRREEALFEIMDKAKAWAVGLVRHGEIDQHGLGLANKIAMKRAWRHLPIKPDFIACDHMHGLAFETPSEIVKKGDATIISIAAASIVAKVFRDRMMEAFSRKYPEYEFEKHKGYGTKLHLENMEKYGVCPIHRRCFKPVARIELFGKKTKQ
jgi:ribonuclease HII